jgi:hypothetical protein
MTTPKELLYRLRHIESGKYFVRVCREAPLTKKGAPSKAPRNLWNSWRDVAGLVEHDEPMNIDELEARIDEGVRAGLINAKEYTLETFKVSLVPTKENVLGNMVDSITQDMLVDKLTR